MGVDHPAGELPDRPDRHVPQHPHRQAGKVRPGCRLDRQAIEDCPSAVLRLPINAWLAVANEGRQLRCLTIDADHRLTHGLRFHDAVQHHRGAARRLKQPDQGKGPPLRLITQGSCQHRNAAITAP